MDNYNWKDYPMTDESKGMLAYVAQQLMNNGNIGGYKGRQEFIQPISNKVGPEYGAMYANMDDRTINSVLELLRNGYKPAVNARNEFNASPRGYRDFYSRMFLYR